MVGNRREGARGLPGGRARIFRVRSRSVAHSGAAPVHKFRTCRLWFIPAGLNNLTHWQHIIVPCTDGTRVRRVCMHARIYVHIYIYTCSFSKYASIFFFFLREFFSFFYHCSRSIPRILSLSRFSPLLLALLRALKLLTVSIGIESVQDLLTFF